MTVRSPYADRLATIPIVRRTVELSRGTTAYWEYGDADASTETLLVVHGYRGDHHGLEPVIAFLEGVRVISIVHGLELVPLDDGAKVRIGCVS